MAVVTRTPVRHPDNVPSADAARLGGTVVVVAGVVIVALGHVGTLVVLAVAVLGTAAIFAAFRHRPVEVAVGSWVVTIVESTVSAYFPQPLSGLIKTVDEPLLMVLFVATLVFHRRNRNPGRKLVLVPAAGILFAGWASVIVNGVSPDAAILGTWQGMKLWTVLYIVVQIPWTWESYERALGFMKVVGVIAVVGAVVELVAPGPFQSLIPVVNEGLEERFGRSGLQSVFTHPGHFGSFATIFAGVFLADFVHGGRRKDLVASLAAITLGVLSLRLKVILGFLGSLGALVVASPSRFLRRVGIVMLVGGAFIAMGGGLVTDLATVQIERYLLSEDDTIRQTLYETSREIGVDEVPFGKGFGRFGTGAATEYDSPVYAEYGLGSTPGLSQERPEIRHDTTWPTVLGETGYTGLVVYVGGLLLIWVTLLRQSRRSRTRSRPRLQRASLIASTVLVGVLFESLGRPSFFNAITTLTVALLVAPSLALAGAQEPEVTPEPARTARRGVARRRIATAR